MSVKVGQRYKVVVKERASGAVIDYARSYSGMEVEVQATKWRGNSDILGLLITKGVDSNVTGNNITMYLDDFKNMTKPLCRARALT